MTKSLTGDCFERCWNPLPTEGIHLIKDRQTPKRRLSVLFSMGEGRVGDNTMPPVPVRQLPSDSHN